MMSLEQWPSRRLRPGSVTSRWCRHGEALRGRGWSRSAMRDRGPDLRGHVRPSLEALGILRPREPGEVGHNPIRDAVVALDELVGEIVPARRHYEVLEDVVGHDRRHARQVSCLLAFSDALGGSFEPDLLEDEGIVRGRPVEGDLHARKLTPPRPFVVTVSDCGEAGNDDLQVAAVSPRSRRPGGKVRTEI